MRRKDKARMDKDAIDEIIQQSEICHLSCCLDNTPYLVPIAFGYDGKAVYIHTAPAGKKIEMFERNPRVCLAFVARINLISSPDLACNWSFGYSSVIAEGDISEITERGDKLYGLNQVMAHYSGQEWDFPEDTVSETRVWKIVLEDPTGKISPAPK